MKRLYTVPKVRTSFGGFKLMNPLPNMLNPPFNHLSGVCSKQLCRLFAAFSRSLPYSIVSPKPIMMRGANFRYISCDLVRTLRTHFT